ncbi:MAG: hypothetical protein BSOLF_1199 [Candidatus Carbobacillus altaicus]|uniref:Uncharacterized protein n=1 Tax=Candidatus Carbonibacillus altaicus TaxID=2163959 RepID=A0A2R6Y4S7_9BACL|nr:MAG: hypothetical protein BSOLF_1199 [Candidatus Carbobacillus altaicus]
MLLSYVFSGKSANTKTYRSTIIFIIPYHAWTISLNML